MQRQEEWKPEGWCQHPKYRKQTNKWLFGIHGSAQSSSKINQICKSHDIQTTSNRQEHRHPPGSVEHFVPPGVRLCDNHSATYITGIEEQKKRGLSGRPTTTISTHIINDSSGRRMGRYRAASFSHRAQENRASQHAVRPATIIRVPKVASSDQRQL